ncbi:MAG: hypothetical protein AAB474_00020 [Patescibacteria group bacterium]
MLKQERLKIRNLKIECPNCGSRHFSISVNTTDSMRVRPMNWDSQALGEADCRGCQKEFLVKLPPEFQNAIKSLLAYHRISNIDKIIKALFG